MYSLKKGTQSLLSPDFDPDTVQWIPTNHPFSTTARDINEYLAQTNVHQKHGVPFRIKAKHEVMQRKLEALHSVKDCTQYFKRNLLSPFILLECFACRTLAHFRSLLILVLTSLNFSGKEYLLFCMFIVFDTLFRFGI